ncbi:MAG: ABC transporter permease subunit [Oscillospiraceae bacterium]|nr:ABC transporter permease subunit [Oscillospiraceae bacterium]
MMPSTTLKNKRDHPALRIVIPLVIWLGVWQLAAHCIGHDLLLPGPVTVGVAWLRLAGTAAFWLTTLSSLAHIFGGFLLGVLCGVALAVPSAYSVWVYRIVSPVMEVIRATPVASFIILLLLWSPTGWVPTIAAILMVMPVVWGNVTQGVAQTDPLLLECAVAYRFSRGKTARLVTIPSVLPYFMSACNTGVGLAWKAGVAAEVLCKPGRAIGTALYNAKITLQTPELFAWTAMIIVLSFAVGHLLKRLFRVWTGVVQT